MPARVSSSSLSLARKPYGKAIREKEGGGSGVSTKLTTTSVGAQGPPSWFRRDWLWGLILILAVILAYTPVWRAGFIWDDDVHLTANPCIVGPLGLKEIWTTSAADICPLVLTTFWVEHALWGLEPLPYHLVNVLLHGACAVLLWRVLRSLRVQGAWLGAALWALHPVEVESVAWITEMKNTRIGFVLPAIDPFLCEVAKSKRPRRTNRRWLELCVNLAFRRSGDGQQVFHGDSAGCSLLVRLVDGGPVALAQPGESGPHLSDVHRRQLPYRYGRKGCIWRQSPIRNGCGLGRSAWRQRVTRSGFISASCFGRIR